MSYYGDHRPTHQVQDEYDADPSALNYMRLQEAKRRDIDGFTNAGSQGNTGSGYGPADSKQTKIFVFGMLGLIMLGLIPMAWFHFKQWLNEPAEIYVDQNVPCAASNCFSVPTSKIRGTVYLADKTKKPGTYDPTYHGSTVNVQLDDVAATDSQQAAALIHKAIQTPGFYCRGDTASNYSSETKKYIYSYSIESKDESIGLKCWINGKQDLGKMLVAQGIVPQSIGHIAYPNEQYEACAKHLGIWTNKEIVRKYHACPVGLWEKDAQ